jgi:hypothetical protein
MHQDSEDRQGFAISHGDSYYMMMECCGKSLIVFISLDVQASESRLRPDDEPPAHEHGFHE